MNLHGRQAVMKIVLPMLLSLPAVPGAGAAGASEAGGTGDVTIEATIELLSPSDFVERPVVDDRLLRAVSTGAPDSAYIRFELRRSGRTVAGTRFTQRADDRWWQAVLDIPSGLDEGPYVLRVRLFDEASDVIARDAQRVVYRDTDRSQGAPQVSFTGPMSWENWGFYDPPGLRPVSVVSVDGDGSFRQAVLYYTMSRAHQDPRWIRCGRRSDAEHTRRGVGECFLRRRRHIQRVTALAAVPYSTPFPRRPRHAARGMADVSVIDPFEIEPRLRIRLDSAGERCLSIWVTAISQAEEGDLTQLVSRAPVDLHLSSETRQSFAAQTGQLFAAPDRGHGGSERAPRCHRGALARSQSRHQDATPHVELLRGTEVRFPFPSVNLLATGTTDVVASAWIDQRPDDVHQPWEPYDEIIFGQDVLLSLNASDQSVTRGQEVELSGANDGSMYWCRDYSYIELQMEDIPGSGTYRKVAESQTDAHGHYVFEVEVNSTATYRTLMPARGQCVESRSDPVTVTVE